MGSPSTEISKDAKKLTHLAVKVGMRHYSYLAAGISKEGFNLAPRNAMRVRVGGHQHREILQWPQST